MRLKPKLRNGNGETVAKGGGGCKEAAARTQIADIIIRMHP